MEKKNKKQAENVNNVNEKLLLSDVIISCTKEKFLIAVKDALIGCVKTVGDSYSRETDWITDEDIQSIAKEIVDGCN
jgi:hypothetical protein